MQAIGFAGGYDWGGEWGQPRTARFDLFHWEGFDSFPTVKGQKKAETDRILTKYRVWNRCAWFYVEKRTCILFGIVV